MKKLLSVVLAFALIVCAVPLGAFTVTVSAYTEGYYTYGILRSEGAAIITDVNTSISGNVTVPSRLGGYPVTVIDGSAFEDCVAITKVTIPNSVTYIEYSAFEGCVSLSSVVLPNTITHINYGTFSDCVALNSITIPGSVISIGENAFSKCRSLTSITIPDSVINIEESAFYECSNLASITLGKGVVSIGDWAFHGCDNLRDVHYCGTSAMANRIVIGNWNTPLIDATWHYRLYPDAATNAWYSEAVKYVSENGIMSGYQNGLFGTSDSIKRQDFLVMLARLDGVNLNNYKYKSSFPDVTRNSYYEAAVNWGAQKGIVTGYQNGKFGVSDKVTREQIVTFLYRYADYKGYDSDYSSNRENVVSRQYKDYKNVSGFAKQPILWAIEKGVISGKTSSTIAPQGNAQRCEVAKIMYNIYLNDIFK